MNKTAMRVRSMLLAVVCNPGVFALTAFVISGMFMTEKLSQVRGLLELNLLVPWGLALALVRLERAWQENRPLRADVAVLCVLFAWLVVPFYIRFGLSSTNMNTWQSFAIIFFGLFAMLAEADEKRIARALDAASLLATAASFVFAGALLYCAATVQNFRNDYSEFGFGVYQYIQLCAEQHYNGTGMLAMCGTFLCLIGVSRRQNKPLRALHLLAAVMMALVVVLTQSRTARYSLLAGLAVGAYGAVAASRLNKRALVRHAAGILAGAFVLVGGYVLSAKITDAALMHYAKARAGQQTVSLVMSAKAEEEAAQEAQEEPAIQVEQARGAGEGTFTGRTDVWKNIFSMWKKNPKYFVIGNGVGRTSRDILIGTPLEHGGANMAHNAYIQFTMDHGLMAALLLCAFFGTLLMPALRVLLGASATGGRAMCMLAVGCLLTGMMENEPLSAMRPCNVALFFALGVIACLGAKKKN